MRVRMHATRVEMRSRLRHDLGHDALPRRAIGPNADDLALCVANRRGEVEREAARPEHARNRGVGLKIAVVSLPLGYGAADATLEPLFAAHAGPDQFLRRERRAIGLHGVDRTHVAIGIGDDHQVIDAVGLRIEVGRRLSLLSRPACHRVECKRLHVAVALEQIAIDLLDRSFRFGAKAVASALLEARARTHERNHANDNDGEQAKGEECSRQTAANRGDGEHVDAISEGTIPWSSPDRSALDDRALACCPGGSRLVRICATPKCGLAT